MLLNQNQIGEIMSNREKALVLMARSLIALDDKDHRSMTKVQIEPYVLRAIKICDKESHSKPPLSVV